MIQKNKSGTFTVIWRDAAREGDAKDKRSFKTFEKYGDAKKFENKLQSELAEGTYAAPSNHTLKEIATLYLEAGAGRFRVITMRRGTSRNISTRSSATVR
jgi:hypothetical protein